MTEFVRMVERAQESMASMRQKAWGKVWESRNGNSGSSRKFQEVGGTSGKNSRGITGEEVGAHRACT